MDEYGDSGTDRACHLATDGPVGEADLNTRRYFGVIKGPTDSA